MNQLVAIIIVSFLIAVGRFTVPGHALTGWSGFYETMAHMWVGALIVFAYYMPRTDDMHSDPASIGIRSFGTRWIIIGVLVFITLVEVVMYLVDMR